MSVAAAPSKVTASHLDRLAYLYVRQSTLRQVLNSTPCASARSRSAGRPSGSW
jgi:hypothetical protein